MAKRLLNTNPTANMRCAFSAKMTESSAPAKNAVDASDNLYVLGGYVSNDNVTVYPPAGSAPLRTMTEGIVDKQAHSMVLDSLADVYVSNGGYSPSGDPGSVIVYPPGGSTPIRTVTEGIHNPVSLAVGP